MKISFPLWTRYRVWGVENNAGVEVVEDFVDFLDLIVGGSCVSEAGERYWRRQRHTLRVASLPARRSGEMIKPG